MWPVETFPEPDLQRLEHGQWGWKDIIWNVKPRDRENPEPEQDKKSDQRVYDIP
jgi:hypothetical protein